MINLLINDQDFLSSMEETLGKIQKVWVDWKLDKIFYELMAGDLKESCLSQIIDKLREINYLKAYEQ